MLTKRRAAASRPAIVPPAEQARAVDRRQFLRNSGLAGAVGAAGIVGAFGVGTVQRARAGDVVPGVAEETKKSICPHCSVGCTVIARVQKGVWVGQDPAFDSPINLGTHCAKGASVRELVSGERRLKYPMKLVDGEWKRISWTQAIQEVGDRLLNIRNTSGPDSVFWLGSAKFMNETAYLFRKFGAMWGTNTVDHQARICHSTTVAGVANTFGYGAQTNSYNDLVQLPRPSWSWAATRPRRIRWRMQHLLRSKELNKSQFIVLDPRFTRTAAHATEYIRIRPGTDIPVMWGILWHVFENGWEDKEFIRQRVYGMDEIRAEVAKWTPEEVERVSGVPGPQLRRVAEIMAMNRPSTVVWCMGATQKTVGTANVRAYSILQLALGNMGKVRAAGTNIFRGHDNVQGATDMGVDVTTLPAYLGLDEGAWRHFCRAWGVEYEWMLSRFASKKLMETKGIPTTRWFDGVTLPTGVSWINRTTSSAMMVFGPRGQLRSPASRRCAPGSTSSSYAGGGRSASDDVRDLRQPPQKRHLSAARLHVVRAVRGRLTASNRSLQWREQVVKPIFESKHGRRDPLSAGQEVRVSPNSSARTSTCDGTTSPSSRTSCARSTASCCGDRLFRRVAGADQAAHAAPGRFQPDDADGRERAV